MRKLQKEEANRAIETLFSMPEGTLNYFVLVLDTDESYEVFSSMCCDRHTYQTLNQAAQDMMITTEHGLS